MKEVKIIITIAVSFAFVINTIMVTNSKTRRSADEIATINLSEMNEQLVCKQNGGTLNYTEGGDYRNCTFK